MGVLWHLSGEYNFIGMAYYRLSRPNIPKTLTEDITESGTLGGGPGMFKILPKWDPNTIKQFAKIWSKLGWHIAFVLVTLAIGEVASLGKDNIGKARRLD